MPLTKKYERNPYQRALDFNPNAFIRESNVVGFILRIEAAPDSPNILSWLLLNAFSMISLSSRFHSSRVTIV